MWLDLANLQSEMGQQVAAFESYNRVSKIFRLLERPMAHWLAGRRSDTAYLCGEQDVAREMAWLAGNPFHVSVARALTEAGPDARRCCCPCPSFDNTISPACRRRSLRSAATGPCRRITW